MHSAGPDIRKVPMVYFPPREGRLPVLSFLLAIIILAIGPIGTLTIPGIIAGIAAIGCSLYKKYGITAIIAVTAFSSSLIGQGLTVMCIYCIIAALLFAIGGLLSLEIQCKKNVVWLVLVLPMVISLLFFAIRTTPSDSRTVQVVIYDGPKIAQIQPNKAVLFVTPDCYSCRQSIKKYCEADPNGERWQPVIVPNGMVAKGTRILRESGYNGSVYSSSSSPVTLVPSLRIGTKVFIGTRNVNAQIQNIMKGEL